MKFKYKPFQNMMADNGDFLVFPLLQVTLKNGRESLSLDCLVDSGAGNCLFSTDIAQILGVDLSSAAKQEYYGIGNIAVTGYKSDIQLKVSGFEKWITIEAGFVDQNEMPLLGHSGFFENYEVIFRAYHNRFEIKSSGMRPPRPKKPRN